MSAINGLTLGKRPCLFGSCVYSDNVLQGRPVLQQQKRKYMCRCLNTSLNSVSLHKLYIVIRDIKHVKRGMLNAM